MTTNHSPHVAKKRQRRRAEILNAALHAFRDKGYHATTLEDIARRMGVRKTAFYHYFPDKESILCACHRESLAELDRIMLEARRLKSASAKLTHVIREHVAVMTQSLDGAPLAFEVSAFSSRRKAEMIAGRDRYERALRRIIEDGVQRGEFRKADPKVAAFVILGAINWISRWYRPEGALHAPELGNLFVNQLMGGLSVHN